MAGTAARVAEQAQRLLGCWARVRGEGTCFHCTVSGGKLLFNQVHVRHSGTLERYRGEFTPCVHTGEVVWRMTLEGADYVQMWAVLRDGELYLSHKTMVRTSARITVKGQHVILGQPQPWSQQDVDGLFTISPVAGDGVLLDVHPSEGMEPWLKAFAWRAKMWSDRVVTRINGVAVSSVQEAREKVNGVVGTSDPLTFEFDSRDQELGDGDPLAFACRAKGCRLPDGFDPPGHGHHYRGGGDPLAVIEPKVAAALAGEIDAHGKEDDATFKEFTCAICTMHAYKVPVSTTCCGHAFHRHCIERALQHGAPCPICQKLRVPGKDRVADAPAFVKRALAHAEVKCPQGCGSLLFHDNLGEHIMEKDGCSNTPMLCRNTGCGEVLKRPRAEEHAASCKHARVICMDCGMRIRKDDIQQHQESVCPRRPAPCKHCQAAVPRGDMEQHFRAACTGTVAVPVQAAFAMREAQAKADLPAMWDARFDPAEDCWRYAHRVTGTVQTEKPKQ
eukprot:TRINITY_DN831_c0_g2_i2.p1 TRINITY_DN831_c0_g2~~TRINITY_DN831_c0_g2_i2.p1  ORF type:complete len:503 (+),score=127.55 TRINITY_DN831_c0_g2_i2:67-1575(+)